MKRKLIYVFLTILTAAIVAGVLYLNSLIPIITGYAAKNLASGVFISGRNATDIESLDLNFSFIRYTSNEVDTANKRVISRFLWGNQRPFTAMVLGVHCFAMWMKKH